jgi:hypothetical protein
MRRNDHLDTALREIKSAGGVIDRIDHRKHIKLYWRLGDHKLVCVVPSTSCSVRAVWNITGDIRRLARQLCPIDTTPSNCSISVLALD